MNVTALLGLESELHEVMEAWQTAETVEALEAAEQAVAVYVGKSVQAVDSFRDYMVGCESLAEAMEAQAQKHTDNAIMWRARYDRLYQGILGVMNALGKKELVGTYGRFKRQGNGGLAPLLIQSEAMIPDECCRFVGAIDGPLWLSMLKQLDPATCAILTAQMKREVSNTAVRKAVATPEGCPGARLDQRGEQLRIT